MLTPDIAPLVEYLTVDKWITGQVIFCESQLKAGLGSGMKVSG